MATRCDGVRSRVGLLGKIRCPDPAPITEEPLDKSVLALPLTRRHRDRKHLRFCCGLSLHCVWATALRSTPPAICASSRAWTKSQRRIYGPGMPGPTIANCMCRQGNELVDKTRHRPTGFGTVSVAAQPSGFVARSLNMTAAMPSTAEKRGSRRASSCFSGARGQDMVTSRRQHCRVPSRTC
jgi:hypothetical protein